MATQAMISLVILGLVIARAVNIFTQAEPGPRHRGSAASLGSAGGPRRRSQAPVAPLGASAPHWWIGVLFAIGSACFFVGPFPGFIDLVGSSADGVVFFVGSLFFTCAALLQLRMRLRALDRRLVGDPGPARRDRLLQRRHLPGDAAQLRHRRRRPAGLAPRGVRLRLLPGFRLLAYRAVRHLREGRSSRGSRPSTSPAASCSGSRPSAATCCRRPGTPSTCRSPTPAPRLVPSAS